MAAPRFSRRNAALLCAAAVCAAAAGAAVLPARWLLAVLPHDTPLALADAAGTLWRGSAWIALGPPGARRMLPQPLQWRWRWDTLALEISHPWLQGALQARPAWNGLSLSAQSLRAPASTLAALGAPWNTMAPQGTLEIAWQPLRLGAALPAGPLAEVRWRNAATALAPVASVGTYVLRVQGGKNGAALTLSTENGLLDVTGQGSATGGGLRFQGQARYAASAGEAERAALEGFMSMLGRRSGDVVSFGV
ncbi:general secretion pathway protein GspN [Achromobacter xylosoxidans]|nr:general secretion pathway protein GspN [Achromobacter xylosoxidans]